MENWEATRDLMNQVAAIIREHASEPLHASIVFDGDRVFVGAGAPCPDMPPEVRERLLEMARKGVELTDQAREDEQDSA